MSRRLNSVVEKYRFKYPLTDSTLEKPGGVPMCSATAVANSWARCGTGVFGRSVFGLVRTSWAAILKKVVAIPHSPENGIGAQVNSAASESPSSSRKLFIDAVSDEISRSKIADNEFSSSTYCAQTLLPDNEAMAEGPSDFTPTRALRGNYII